MSLYTAVKTVANQNDKSIYQIEKDLHLSLDKPGSPAKI